MPDFINPYQEPRNESQGEKDQRIAAQLAGVIVVALRFVRRWLKKFFKEP